MKTIPDTLSLVNLALQQLQQELARHEEGQGTVGNLNQLVYMKQVLERMRTELEGGKLTPKPERKRKGFGRIIADSWPVQDEHKLGELLLQAEQVYCRLE